MSAGQNNTNIDARVTIEKRKREQLDEVDPLLHQAPPKKTKVDPAPPAPEHEVEESQGEEPQSEEKDTDAPVESKEEAKVETLEEADQEKAPEEKKVTETKNQESEGDKTDEVEEVEHPAPKTVDEESTRAPTVVVEE
eukprot:CAMPEP_0174269362 /NCGR_PEP_ID=MMETSP0439-20130205/40761_1 /TAXON_ID=0 /ORGANISM="Stereomyxa ramosa, Strain Chinc5" /LENGTH=137 /DNA_ID=CAMNT_0015358097 /DNA_START=188 /DNA_END=601 /DNA_ORIENTATION=+